MAVNTWQKGWGRGPAWLVALGESGSPCAQPLMPHLPPPPKLGISPCYFSKQARCMIQTRSVETAFEPGFELCSILQVVNLGQVFSSHLHSLSFFYLSRFDYKCNLPDLESIRSSECGPSTLQLGSWSEGKACLEVRLWNDTWLGSLK